MILRRWCNILGLDKLAKVSFGATRVKCSK